MNQQKTRQFKAITDGGFESVIPGEVYELVREISYPNEQKAYVLRIPQPPYSQYPFFDLFFLQYEVAEVLQS